MASHSGQRQRTWIIWGRKQRSQRPGRSDTTRDDSTRTATKRTVERNGERNRRGVEFEGVLDGFASVCACRAEAGGALTQYQARVWGERGGSCDVDVAGLSGLLGRAGGSAAGSGSADCALLGDTWGRSLQKKAKNGRAWSRLSLVDRWNGTRSLSGRCQPTARQTATLIAIPDGKELENERVRYDLSPRCDCRSKKQPPPKKCSGGCRTRRWYAS